MRFGGKVIAFVFDLDNWAKDIEVNNLNYPSIKEVNDVVYSADEPDICVADLLYNPHSVKYEKYPVILNIHGGGWVIGDKRNSRGQCLQMADSGWFVVNMNYGLPPKPFNMFEKHDPKKSHGDHYYPTQVVQAYKALQWIADNAEKYNLDTDCVVVSGDSAGSHIASVTVTSSSNPELRKGLGLPDPPVNVRGGVLFSGFYDLTYFWGRDIMRVPWFRELAVSIFNTRDIHNHPMYPYFNPIPFVTKDMPKTLVVNGNKDPIT
ncbi:MAG: alpha/beta hydrolase, partial [Clostridia bacterium]|nr:alpha/beta hydrolase [Clostridia bacterium]